jgi:membrane-bound lytic murein transglycosylase B
MLALFLLTSPTVLANPETNYNFNQNESESKKAVAPGKKRPAASRASRKPAATSKTRKVRRPLPKHYRGTYAAHPEAQKFIDLAVKKHKFNRRKLLKLFSRVRKRKDVLRLMNRQAEDMPWYKYRRLFIRKKRIRNGVRFWNRHARTLARAEKKYGVPREIIVAIIGVETFYGTRKGRNVILESLSTLAFDYPRRSKFFQKELMHFLILSREEGWNAGRLKGSFAGAMGAPQFIPSSYRRYAVDFDGDGHRDLFHSKADAIGSVANYFKTFGWERGKLIITRARIRGRKYRRIKNFKSRPNTTLRQLARHGVTPRFRLPRSARKDPVAIIKLKQRKYHEYWIGFKNFYVITRYNHSSHYAKVVFDLSRKIKRARYAQLKRKRKRRYKRSRRRRR